MTASPVGLSEGLVRYRLGWCDVFALALHEATGWPLALIEGQFVDEDGAPGDLYAQPAHAVCVPSAGWVADVDGVRPAESVCGQVCFGQAEAPLAVLVRTATRAEVESAFTMEPVDGYALAQARRDVARLIAAGRFVGSGALSR